MKQNNFLLFLITLITFFCTVQAEEKPISLVQEHDQVSDYEARMAYAQALSANRRTLREALRQYKILLKQRPDDAMVYLEVQRIQWSISHPEEPKNPSLIQREDWMSNYEARLSLAHLDSYKKRTYAEALQQYGELLARSPNNPELLLDVAQIYVNERRYPEAVWVLGRISVPPNSLELQLKLAQLEDSLGYFERSHQRFVYILAQRPNSEKVRLAFASAMMSWGDFYNAERIYSNYFAENPHSIEAITHVVDVLVATQRFVEAETMACKQLSLHPEYQEILLNKILTIKKYQNDFVAALAIADQLVECYPCTIDYQLDRAELLYKMDYFEDALRIYLTFTNNPEYAGQASLGAGKSYLKLGDISLAETILQTALQDSSTKIAAEFYLNQCTLDVSQIIQDYAYAQDLQVWADQFAEEGLLDPMIELYQAAVQKDPDFLPAKLNLADSLSSKREYLSSYELYEELLDVFPLNAKYLLGRARVLSWDKQYDIALEHYNELINLNPCNPIPRLEQARVAFWARYFDLSMNYFCKLLNQTSNCLLYREIWLEMTALRRAWNRRIIHSLHEYQELRCLDPGNAIWKFEYAQALCSLGLCEEPIELYRDILHDNPLHTLAAMALEREEMQYCSNATLNYDWWQERGYGDLAQIGRYEIIGAYTYPMTCNHHLRFAQRRWIEHTYYDGQFHIADGQTLEWNGRFNPYISGVLGATNKQYLQHFKPTFTWNAELSLNLYDNAIVRFGYKKRDEIYNFFNLQQNTQGKISWIEIQSNLTHKLQVNSYYEYLIYNDNNNLKHGFVTAAYAFTEYPNVFKASITGEYRDTAHTNIFITNAAGKTIDIIHPYWAPQNYGLGQIQFEFRHDFALLEFCGAPICFYDIKFAFGDDTQHNPYWEVKGEWQYEFYYHWKFDLVGYVHRSPQWDANGLWCTVDYRF